jgi:hypothetical protein
MSVQKKNFSKNTKKKKKKKLLFSVCKDCFYRSHPYFNKDPSIEYAQFPVGIRYHNAFGRMVNQRLGARQGLRQGQGSESVQGRWPRSEGVVAETLLRIVEATRGTRWKTTGSAQAFRGTRKTVKTLEIDVASLPLIQRGIDQTIVSVLKLMMIIPVYAHFSMLRRLL